MDLTLVPSLYWKEQIELRVNAKPDCNGRDRLDGKNEIILDEKKKTTFLAVDRPSFLILQSTIRNDVSDNNTVNKW